jgi:hypothetical protein
MASRDVHTDNAFDGNTMYCASGSPGLAPTCGSLCCKVLPLSTPLAALVHAPASSLHCLLQKPIHVPKVMRHNACTALHGVTPCSCIPTPACGHQPTLPAGWFFCILHVAAGFGPCTHPQRSTAEPGGCRPARSKRGGCGARQARGRQPAGSIYGLHSGTCCGTVTATSCPLHNPAVASSRRPT